jgi:hypothetical protein
MRLHRGLVVSIVILAAPGAARAQAPVFSIEAAAAGVLSTASDADRQYLLRAIPQIDWGRAVSTDWKFDVTASLSAATGATYLSGAKVSGDSDVDAHRVWARLASARFETRVGLQQISFGSAAVFRPLMWFDRLDARDPLQFTKGVYGALARYVTAGNASVWAWALYGNDDPRGWDALGTKADTPEFGGRAQAPFLGGELAGSYHHRAADTTPFLPPGSPPDSARENRVGVDGKWDLGVGVWFETSFTHTASTALRREWQPSWTVGADYTFGVGSGLTLLGEQFYLDPAVPAFAPPATLELTAVTATYPVGVANMLTGALYYEWRRANAYRFVEWRRTYDHWRFHVIGFWNPDQASLFAPGSQASALTGKGVELVIVASY